MFSLTDNRLKDNPKVNGLHKVCSEGRVFGQTDFLASGDRRATTHFFLLQPQAGQVAAVLASPAPVEQVSYKRKSRLLTVSTASLR